MRPPFVRQTVALAAAVTLCSGLLVGCGGNKDDGNTNGDDSTKKNSRSSAGVLEVDLANPLATNTFDIPGSTNDRVDIGVLGLTVEGDLQVLHLVFTPHFGSENRANTISLSRMLGKKYANAKFAPRLIDRKNLKIYHVVENFRTADGAEVTNGVSMYVYAVFAAPQDADAVFDLQIRDSWMPFTQVKPEK
ncbi:MAG: hypothetical protein FWE61_04005 [Micrococcales bacterium]|nr:hypothetical protein [Micrococcales bacterium]